MIIIDNSNKEEVFNGLLQRKYDLDDIKSIKTQFQQDPSLAREYAFHKRVVEDAYKIETEEIRRKVVEHNREEQHTNIFTKSWRQYPYAIAAAITLLLIAGIGFFYLNQPDTQQMAQQVEIPYQEISPGGFGAAGTADTLDRSTFILQYPDVDKKAYSFRGDTLVLYGKFDFQQLKYRFNTQTQERTLFIGAEKKILEYTVEKQGL